MPTIARSAAACLERRYTRLPDALISALSPREHQLVHCLLSYRWHADSVIVPRVRTLAERLGCTERTVQRTLRALEARGYLVVAARYRDDRGQTSNEYRPGPALASLLRATVVTSAPQARRPPVTAPSDRTRYRNQNMETRTMQPGGCYLCGGSGHPWTGCPGYPTLRR